MHCMGRSILLGVAWLLVAGTLHAQRAVPVDTGSVPMVLRQPDSRLIYFAATGGNFYCDRLYASGEVDDAFNGIRTSKKAWGPAGSCRTRTATLDKWNRILIAGSCRKAGHSVPTLVRLNKTGDPDGDFEGMVQPVVGDSARFEAIITLPDERMMGVGTCWTSGVAHIFLSGHQYNGARDERFGTAGVLIDETLPGSVYAIGAARQPDGKLVVCANTITNDSTAVLLVRYAPNGSRDVSFGQNGVVALSEGANTTIWGRKMLMLADGGIQAGGTITEADGSKTLFVAKYTTNGQADTTFGNGGVTKVPLMASGRMDDMAFLPDSGLVISATGKAKAVMNGSRQILLRCNAAGKLDSAWGFGAPNGIKAQILKNGALAVGHSIVVSPRDGRVYAVSEMTEAGKPETTVYLNAFLQSNDLGIVDMADRRRQNLAYPLLVDGEVSFSYELVDSQRVTVTVTDETGKTVSAIAQNELKPEGEHQLKVPIPATWPAGRYVVILATSEDKKTSIDIFKK